MSSKQVLVCNAGSTSLKFRLFTMPEEKVIASAKIERIGSQKSWFSMSAGDALLLEEEVSIPDYESGIARFISEAKKHEVALAPDVLGFKTVLADGYFGVHKVDPLVLDAMRAWQDVAPAHNGPYLAVMKSLADTWPEVLQVALFETYFHRTIPEPRRLYGIPLEWSEAYGIKRYGYHGTSHRFVSETLGGAFDDATHIISCHLGGSGSISAILNGESISNSFGFSLQTGVMHNNRAGDLDAFIFPFLMRRGLTSEAIEKALTKESGLLGVSGISGDLRDIEEQLDINPRANLAFDVYVEHVLREVGSAYAVLGGLTDFVFTGGIGENSPLLRAEVVSKLSHFGLRLADEKNIEVPEDRRIDDGGVRIHVINTNEELVVAREVYQCQFS